VVPKAGDKILQFRERDLDAHVIESTPKWSR
jgi:hypothetical protein